MFESLSQWLADTSLSQMFSDTTRLETWLIVPISQTVHILAVTVVMISVGMLNLRMLGLAGTRQTFPQLANQLIPWVWGALIVLFVTGLIQTIAEPGRELLNYGFRIKMVLLALSVAVTVFYEHSVRNDPNYWILSPERQKMGRFLAISSLTMWVVIASLGRLIAYVDTRAVR